jgi:hypothetical protein
MKVEVSLLIKWDALYALTNLWRREEMEKNVHTRSPRRGEAMVAHDVHVNSSPKFDLKPRRSAAFFYRLFLL